MSCSSGLPPRRVASSLLSSLRGASRRPARSATGGTSVARALARVGRAVGWFSPPQLSSKGSWGVGVHRSSLPLVLLSSLVDPPAVRPRSTRGTTGVLAVRALFVSPRPRSSAALLWGLPSLLVARRFARAAPLLCRAPTPRGALCMRGGPCCTWRASHPARGEFARRAEPGSRALLCSLSMFLRSSVARRAGRSELPPLGARAHRRKSGHATHARNLGRAPERRAHSKISAQITLALFSARQRLITLDYV